jgi:hypothetical protein
MSKEALATCYLEELRKQRESLTLRRRNVNFLPHLRQSTESGSQTAPSHSEQSKGKISSTGFAQVE